MTLRQVTPASGAKQLAISYAVGGTAWPQNDVLLSGQVLDVIPSSPLETAIGLSNLTALAAHTTLSEQQGSNGQATSNCGV